MTERHAFLSLLLATSCLLLACSAKKADVLQGDMGTPNAGSGAAVGGNGGSGSQTTAGNGAVGSAGTSGTNGATGAGGAAGHDADAGTGSCDPGTTTTEWAKNCQTTASTTCMAGTWTDPGSTTNDPLVCESAHFAVHAPNGTINQSQCTNATNTLEQTIWPTLFGSPIFFPEPYCNSADKHKASIVVHSDYGLTGGGWGNGYMGMWIGPGGTADHWGLAHEFMHAVQSTTKGLDCGGGKPNTCGWMWESHANWRAQQLPEYHTSNVHCSELLVNAPHLYLGSTRDRYCNWQFMEYLKDKYCFAAVNQIWTASQTSADPFDNIASTRGWTLDQMNDFFGEWAMHNVTWDYQDPEPQDSAGQNQGALYRSKYGDITDTSKQERRLRTVRMEPLDEALHRYSVPTLQAPQRYGYNLVRLYPEAGASEVKVVFRGVIQPEAHSDFRWGLVATDAAITTPRYSKLMHGTDGTLSFCMNPEEALFLVVTGTPSEATHIVWDQLYPTLYRYPYMIEVNGALPEGFQPNAPNPSQNGMRWPNGGGWVASEASVDPAAYVGPHATVLGGTVGASARIEDYATVVGGTVTSGTIGGLTVLGAGATVKDSARVVLSWPYGPGWFEKPQTISGTAVMLGDLELRGQDLGKSSGTYCGIVEAKDNDNCTPKDVNVAPPYKWRP